MESSECLTTNRHMVVLQATEGAIEVLPVIFSQSLLNVPLESKVEAHMSLLLVLRTTNRHMVVLQATEGESVTVLESGENYAIKIKALFKKDMEEPVMGFTVKALNGLEVFGTSTLIANRPIEPVKAGTVVEAEFEQKMRLNSGSYCLTSSIAEFTLNNRIFHDRRMDVIVFKVVGKDFSYGLVNMETSIRLNYVSDNNRRNA